MPKKRHWGMYTKPQSTAPHALESSGRQSNIHHDVPQSRNVNDLLASLRRASLAQRANHDGDGGSNLGSNSFRLSSPSPITAVQPSVPPEIAHILLPDAPTNGGGMAHLIGAANGPAAHALHVNGGAGAIHGAGMGAAAGRGGVGIAGGVGAGAGIRRRAPAGPAPPPSWLAQSRHAPRQASSQADRQQPISDKNRTRTRPRYPGLRMPGVSIPAEGSLVDKSLRRMAADWDIQKHYNQHYLIHLQGPLRAALISYLGNYLGDDGKGVSIGDLKALLLPPQRSSPSDGSSGSASGSEESGEEELALPSPSTLNEDLRCIDLAGSVGQSISIKEVSDLLFPGRTAGIASNASLLESWDAPGSVSPPRSLVPNLTHLSLALKPGRTSHVSWRQLLAFAAHLPTLTHLSLAFWPEPTLTPNARFTTVLSPQGRRLQYGGTGFYSHSLDNDWAEAVLLVRKLSKALYGLEYLDLTGCVSWFPALMQRVDKDHVDWVGDWGKITMLVLSHGASNNHSEPMAGYGDSDDVAMQQAVDVAWRASATDTAKDIERYIRQQRAGRGRIITVEYERTI